MRRQVVFAMAVSLVFAACARDDAGSSTTTPGTTLLAAAATTTSTTSTTSIPVTTPTPTSISSTSTSISIPATTTTPTPTSTSTTTLPPPPPPTTVAAPPPPPARTGPIWDVRPKSDIPPPPVPEEWSTATIGTSVLGREIGALHRPVETARLRVVVIGGVHGNEPVSPPIVRSLVDVPLPPDVEVWLVPEMNPDGVAAGTRANANAVDLNRNFGWGWLPSDGGPAPFSEPESTAAAELVLRVQPHVVVWVHQPLGYVSSIGSTPDAFEEAWSFGSGVRVRRDVSQHGGGESWTNFTAGFPSMLIEADTWAATPEMVAAHRNGFAELLAALG